MFNTPMKNLDTLPVEPDFINSVILPTILVTCSVLKGKES